MSWSMVSTYLRARRFTGSMQTGWRSKPATISRYVLFVRRLAMPVDHRISDIYCIRMSTARSCSKRLVRKLWRCCTENVSTTPPIFFVRGFHHLPLMRLANKLMDELLVLLLASSCLSASLYAAYIVLTPNQRSD